MNDILQQNKSLYKLGGLILKNPVIKAGCFEGMSQNGKVTQELIKHHRRIAEGGVAMTTVAYCSVSFDGRAFDHELWMRREIVPDLKKLTSDIHNEGAAASIQLGHCGYFANRKVIKSRPLGASVKFNLFQLSLCKKMTEKNIREKTDDFVNAAVLAKESGFDAIEIHAGHGYLLSQFISPWTNKRNDNYGGNLENRMRFPAQLISEIRKKLGANFPILVKMNQMDGMKGGLEIDEAIEVAKLFEQAGATAIIPSCGFTSKTPLYMLRGYVPVKEMVKNRKSWYEKTGLLLFGKMMVQRYDFSRQFLLEGAMKIKKALSIPVVYIGGITDINDLNTAVDKGFDFVQVGRALIHDPDFIKNDISYSQVCDHCNRCVAAMDAGGVYCVSKEIGYLTEMY